MNALTQTALSSVRFYFALTLFSCSVLFFSLYSFGAFLYDFSSFEHSAMTIFKMMISRVIGMYYTEIVPIDTFSAIFFTLPIIFFKSIFLSLILANVSHEYQVNLLNKDFQLNINLRRAIFFCNISMDRRQRNKRTKLLEELEARKKLGKADAKEQGELADEEDNREAALGDSGVQDDAKSINGGLEIYYKLDIKFVI